MCMSSWPLDRAEVWTSQASFAPKDLQAPISRLQSALTASGAGPNGLRVDSQDEEDRDFDLAQAFRRELADLVHQLPAIERSNLVA